MADFQWWSDTFTPSSYFYKTQELLLKLFILLGSRECTRGECQVLAQSGEQGEKKINFFFCLLYACLQSSCQREKEKPEG